jgi:hypothetical protein
MDCKNRRPAINPKGARAMSDPCANKDMAELDLKDVDRIEAYRRRNRILSIRQFAALIATSPQEVTAIRSAIQRANSFESTRISAELKRRIEAQLQHEAAATAKGERDEKASRSRGKK